MPDTTKTTTEKVLDAASKVWDWFDGKKTAIGWVAAMATQFLPAHTLAYQIAQYTAIALGSAGIVHGAVKGDLIGLRK